MNDNLTAEQKTELRLKINARNKKLAAEKAAGMKNDVLASLPYDYRKFLRLKAAEAKKTNLSKKSKSSFYREDDEGRLFVSRESLQARYDAEAVKRHGNDPLKRFDEWDFPGTPRERKFLLNHDFGSLVKESLTALENEGWVYAYGGVGLGKTSLAMRVTWELLKDKPSEKASFVSMNQYFLDQIKRNNAEEAACRRGEFYDGSLNFGKFVILDDFDKPNFSNEHNTKVMLDLIERLKKKHMVFITANIPLGRKKEVADSTEFSLYTRYSEMPIIKPIIDRLRQQCLILPEFKGESRRRFNLK